MSEITEPIESLNYAINELEKDIKRTIDCDHKTKLRLHHAHLLGIRLFYILFNAFRETGI